MRISRKFVLIVGVTLGVAPIFSSAWAQDGNQQATMLLEIQALRAEIAELRDMVERQGHKLQLMQRASRPSDVPQAQYPVAPTGGSILSAPSYVGTSSPSSAVASVPPLIVSAPQTASPAQQQTAPIGADSPGIANPVGASSSNAHNAEEPAPAFAQDQAGFYRPYPDNSAAQTDTVGKVAIEDRILTPNTPPISQQVPQETPVEERLVGQRAVGINAGSVPQLNPTQPVNNAPVANVPASGVIAVPDFVQTSIPARTPQVQSAPNPNIATQHTPLEPVAVQSQPTAPIANSANNQAAIQPSQSFPANQTAPQIVVQTAPIAPPAVLPETDYYQQGFELLKQSRHAQAVDTFKQQISNYPQGDLADDAHYWIAESMYVNRSLDISKRYFKAIIDNFTQSPRLPDAMLKTAYIEQEQGNQIEARILLQEILQYHPRSNAAISAKNRLAELE